MSYNILIVDDSGSMRKVIKKILHISGFKLGDCLEAGNGREALEVLENNWVDLVLSDIHMPEMDGLGLLRALRAKDGWNDLPVVLITTESNENRIREAMALGARGYVHKPFRPEEICAYLHQIMGDTDGDDVAARDDDCDF